MIKFISKNPPMDRRAVPLDPATVTTIAIKPGQVLKKAASGFALKADGAAVVGGPVWAFTDSSRTDVQAAKSLTVVDGPFVAEVDTDCYIGSPALDAALQIDTGANVGKVVTLAVTADATTLQAIVAYCTRTADADGFIEVKVIR